MRPAKYVAMNYAKGVERFLESMDVAVDMGYKSANTLATYEQHLRFSLSYLSEMDIEDVDSSDVDGLLRHYVTSGDKRSQDGVGKRKSVASQRIFVDSLKAFFTYAINQGWCTLNPVEAMELKVVDRGEKNPAREALSGSELERLYLAFGDEPKTVASAYKYHLDRLLFKILATCGLRNSEARFLKPESVIVRDSGYFLEVVGKGSKRRLVPLSPAVYEQIVDFLSLKELMVKNYHIQPSDYIFSLASGIVISRIYPNRLLRRLALVAGMRSPVPHALRHSYASNLLKSGLDVASVRDVMGHSNISTTSTYLESREDDIYLAMKDSGVF